MLVMPEINRMKILGDEERFAGYFSMKFIVTEIERCIDWLKRFKIDVHFLFFPIIGYDCSTVNDQSIIRY